ncbi:MAG: transcription termination/antitermination protein NusG [Clostridia bacterium]|nr:transcription termination/antitermination protein NusG [Clostridia bacterium]
MPNAAKWFIVHTYSGYENKVMDSLKKTVENRQMQDLILDISVPTEMVVEITEDGKKKEVEHKVFPGYVLVKMTLTDDGKVPNESWYAVRNIRGCTGFVGTSTEPIPLTDEEVAKLGVESKTVEVSFNIGDTVQITGGPFDGYIGTIDSMNLDEMRMTVIVSMFGRETPVELEMSQAQLANF